MDRSRLTDWPATKTTTPFPSSCIPVKIYRRVGGYSTCFGRESVMLRMTSASVLVLVLGAVAAAADDKPVGPQPLVYTARMDKEALNLSQFRYKVVPVQKVV